MGRHGQLTSSPETIELLAEARLTYRLRDERGICSDIWASGLTRRAVLASGRRLGVRGGIHAPEHRIEAGFDEMCSLLSNSGGLSGDDLASRLEYRNTQDPKVAPPILRSSPPPPADLSQFPPVMARLMRATGLAMEEMSRSSQAEQEEFVLRGLAASQGLYERPARFVAGPAEFHRIVRGDVLVTESTSEAFTILLPVLGGIVTYHGASFPSPRSWPGNMAFPGSWGPGMPPSASPTAPGSGRRRPGRGDRAEVIEVVPLTAARDVETFGSKAAGLGVSARGGLMVPPGLALSGATSRPWPAGRRRC